MAYCARSAGVYACQRLVLGHHWPVASHQLAVLGRLGLLASQLVRLLGQLHPHLASIALRLPPSTTQLLTEQQFTFITEACSSTGRSFT